MPTVEKEDKGIYRKIHEVMKAVEYLAKDDTISYGTTKYKGLSEEKITRTIREQLVRQQVIVYPIAQSHHREGNLSTVDVTYRFVDTEDGSYIDAVSSGTGADTQDKGVGKAMTYAFKYLFLRTFAIPTGEDPDKISSAELDDREKDAQVQKGKTLILQLLEDNPDLSEDYKDGIILDTDEAVKQEDVNGLRKIYQDVKRELKKHRAPEILENTKKGFDKAAQEYAKAKKYNHEPPLPESEQEDPFPETKQGGIF